MQLTGGVSIKFVKEAVPVARPRAADVALCRIEVQLGSRGILRACLMQLAAFEDTYLGRRSGTCFG